MNHPDKTNIATPDIENVNVTDFDAMPSPEEIHARVPLSDKATQTVMHGREALRNILDRKDPRLFVVVGPCSIHDPAAGLDYARRLKKLADESYIPGEGTIDPTGLYHTLKKMESAGLLMSKWDTESAAQPRKIYEITDEGRSCLANWETTLYNYRDSIDELAKSISSVLKSEDIASSPCKCGKK